MKRLLTILSLVLFCTGLMRAEVIKLQATELSYKYMQDNGRWSKWTDWEDCNILVVMNFDKARVNIYSSTPQEYDIYDADAEESDGQGGTTITLSCVDADGIRCEMRLRRQSDGQLQLYIDYADFMFVYNIQNK